ncbi:MAG TPA: energy transducer TonB [Geothrix sp.]|nr:energy transducer TonB [Geothrix sp.]
MTIPIILEEAPTPATMAPVTRSPGDTGIAKAPEGTGTIDASLLRLEPVLPMAPRTTNIEEWPDPLDHPTKAAVDVRLPVAVGGTGLAHGTGQGHGSGAGQGSGRAMIRGVPGMNPELNLADLEVIHEEIPQYPVLAEWGRIQGDVVVRVTINEKGVPIKTELQEGPPALRAETMRAVKLWRFGRGIFRGRKVEATFDMTFRYILRGP